MVFNKARISVTIARTSVLFEGFQNPSTEVLHFMITIVILLLNNNSKMLILNNLHLKDTVSIYFVFALPKETSFKQSHNTL